MATATSDTKNGETALTIDEALAKTQFGKFNYIIIIFTGLVFNNVVLESVGISFAIPVVKCDLNLTNSQQGILGAVAFIGIICSSHLWGFLADTTGRRRIMLPTLILAFLVTVLSAFSPNFTVLVVLRFLNGFLLSASSATTYAYLGEFHCTLQRNRAILSAALTSASLAILFPLIAFLFINQNWEFYIPYLDIVFLPWRLYTIACGFSGFCCGLVLYFLPESPKYLLAMGRTEEAIAVIQTIYRMNLGRTKTSQSPFQVNTLWPDSDDVLTTSTVNVQAVSDTKKKFVTRLIHSMWQQTAPLFMRPHVHKTLMASLMQFVIYFTAHGVYMWFPYILNNVIKYKALSDEPRCLCDILDYMKPRNNLTLASDEQYESMDCVRKLEIDTYTHTITLELIYVFSLLCVCYAIRTLGRTLMLFLILLICGLCGVLSVLLQLPMTAVYAFIVFLCCGLGVTVVNAIVVDIFPTNLRAMAVCISMMVGRIGSVTGSNVLGLLIEDNCATTLFVSACALILAAFLGFLLPKTSTIIK